MPRSVYAAAYLRVHFDGICLGRLYLEMCVFACVQQVHMQTHTHTAELISFQLLFPSFHLHPSRPFSLPVPGQQAAVVQERFLHIDASVLLRAHDSAVVAPLQLHRLVQVGGGALQRQTVPAENQLPLRGYELKEGQLQRSI